MAEHVIESSVVGSLPVVAERLLTDESLHMGVVRNLVNEEFDEAMLRARTDAERLAIIHSMIPGFDLYQDIVKSWWEVNGYGSRSLEEPVQYSNSKRDRSFPPHIDRPLKFAKKSQQFCGGITLSIAFGPTRHSYADYFARKQKPGYSLRNPDTHEFDDQAYIKCVRRAGRTRRFPASTRQFTGDAVLVMQHPVPATHKILAMNGRRARIIDFPIENLEDTA